MGIIIIAPISNELEQEISVAFVDDTNFFTAGINVKDKIKEILKLYADLFQATGGKIQYKKTTCFS